MRVLLIAFVAVVVTAVALILGVVIFAPIGDGNVGAENLLGSARMRVNVLARCLDDVAEGIGTGSFEPKYVGCIEDILGRDEGRGFRILSEANLRQPVMDLLSERQLGFQEQIDRATATQDVDERRGALVAYQIMLGATAEELRQLVQ